jgi:hypothetical protein
MEENMRSRWIEYRNKRIFYQDFSGLFFNADAVKQELAEVQAAVMAEPVHSVLVISNFHDTEIGSNLMPFLNASSQSTKDHVRKTAVLGVSGVKRSLGDLLSRLTGQPLMYFDTEEEAKEWLTQE